MTLPPVTERQRYRLGRLVYQCLRCATNLRGFTIERSICPGCGGPLNEVPALVFGGMTVRRNRRDFRFLCSSGVVLSIEEADVPDTVAYMTRHTNDLFSAGKDYDEERIQRDSNQRIWTF